MHPSEQFNKEAHAAYLDTVADLRLLMSTAQGEEIEPDDTNRADALQLVVGIMGNPEENAQTMLDEYPAGIWYEREREVTDAWCTVPSSTDHAARMVVQIQGGGPGEYLYFYPDIDGNPYKIEHHYSSGTDFRTLTSTKPERDTLTQYWEYITAGDPLTTIENFKRFQGIG